MLYLLFIGLVALISVGAAAVAVLSRDETRSGAIAVSLIAAVIAVLLFVPATFTQVPAGHVGVPVVLGEVQNRTLKEGFSFVNPLASVHHLSVRTEGYTFSKTHNEGDKEGDDSVMALSSNGMELVMDITVPYRLNPAAAPWVLRNFGPDYREKILRPVICTAVREATSTFTDEEAYGSRREELAKVMQEKLVLQLDKLVSKEYDDGPKSVFSMPQVLLRNVILPKKVKDAIEAKIAAGQENQKMDFVIKMEKKKAEQRVIEAKGIKDFQDIVSQGVTPDLLRWKGIEATEELAKSPNTKIVIVGSGKDGLPVILGGSDGSAK